MATSIGVVRIIPARWPSQFFHDTSRTELEVHRSNAEITGSSYGLIPAKISDEITYLDKRSGENHFRLKKKQIERHEQGDITDVK